MEIENLPDLPDMDGLTLEDKTRMLARWLESAKQSMLQFNEAAKQLAQVKIQNEKEARALAEQAAHLQEIAEILNQKAERLNWPIWTELSQGLESITRPGESAQDTIKRLIENEKHRVKQNHGKRLR